MFTAARIGQECMGVSHYDNTKIKLGDGIVERQVWARGWYKFLDARAGDKLVVVGNVCG